MRRGESGTRFKVFVLATNICDEPNPPEMCGQDCADDAACGVGFICADDGTCLGLCDVEGQPAEISDFVAENHPDSKWSHVVGRLRFTGFFAWLLWLFVHILKLTGFRNRVVVMLDWAWAYWTFNRYARIVTKMIP